jgi:hypothetical protein
MIRHEIISTSDFRKVGLENEYWLWFFRASFDNPSLAIQPLDGLTDKYGFHEFRELMSVLQLPVFQTPTKDAIDFLITLDPNLVIQKIYKKNHFGPLIIGFNHMRLVSSTHHPGACLCTEGIIDIVAKMNVDLLSKIQLD